MDQIVTYIRVSTKKQGESGLGLEAQRAAVQDFAARQSATVLVEYLEVESGKRSDRPELAKAIAHAKRARATLVVAKLDRLARSVAFTSALMESGIDFVACDNPHATRLTIHILAAVAEDEARRISERTKAALAAYKARGGKLGAARPECRNLTAAARQRGAMAGAQAVREQAQAAVADIHETVTNLRSAGFSFQNIATLLNKQGHLTRSGKFWTDVAVLRVSRPTA